MQPFQFYSPTRIIFGPDTETQVGQHILDHGGSRVLVVYGGQSAVKSGLIDRVLDSLTRAGIPYDTISGVQPNPRLSLARTGVEKALAFGADFVLAVGGGSVIDTAKGIADGAANPGTDIWDLWTRKVPLERALPLACILTISAAGSDCSDSAVLTNDETMVKRGLGSDWHRPRFSILNPALTATLPPLQIRCGIVDIMMHTMDRYFNPITTNEMSDAIAEGLLRTVIQNGLRALEQPGDIQALSEMMWCGSLSHNDITGLGGIKDFAPHQLGHELSAKYDCPHGATLSAVWGSWARYCLDTDPARFARFGEKVWGLDNTGKGVEEAALAAIEATEAYFRSIEMPVSLGELEGCGIQSEELLEELTYRCTFRGTRKIGSFRQLGHEDIKAIYRIANH